MAGGARIIEENTEALDQLRPAYADQNLTLYLGAGVSVDNGIPTWEKLVSAMYFSAIKGQPLGSWRPYPNYLFAIAEWHLSRHHEPLDITARKIRNYYATQESFLNSLRQTLYAGFNDPYDDEFQLLEPTLVREANPTLDSVAELCESHNGVRSIITYNYDELLEAILFGCPAQSIYREQKPEANRLPIYHVHGYVPMDPTGGSEANEIVFTEEQYHLAARDDYSWANLVQLQAMTTSVGLMVGLSGTDRNMRRLLDAVRRAPLRYENFILLKKPRWRLPKKDELDQIHESAKGYVETIESSGIKSAGTNGLDYRDQIEGILREVEKLDNMQQGNVLRDLGITPIWYENHTEIPAFISAIQR